MPAQLTQSGYFTGGIVPFGYRLEKQGRLNKKNQEVNDLVIDEDAAQIIRLIFYKYVHEICCAQRISRYLLPGAGAYGVTRLDAIMDTLIRYQLSRIRLSAKDNVIAEQHEKALALAKARYNLSSMQLKEKQAELSDYEAETINVIRGKSRLNIDLLNDLVTRCKAEIEQLMQDVQSDKENFERQMESWADLYDNCTIDRQGGTRFFGASSAAGRVIGVDGRQPIVLVCLASHQICARKTPLDLTAR